MAAYSYCFKCSILLREKDFAKGKAFKVGENVACAACAAGLAPVEPKRDTAPRVRPSSVRIKPAERPAPSRRNRALLGAAALVALSFAGLLPLFMGRSAPPPAEVVDVPPPPPKPKPAEPPTRERLAQDALEAARRIEAPAERAEALERLAWTFEGTKASDAARAELAAAREKTRESVSAALAGLDAELARAEIGASVELLEAAAKRIDAPEWTAALAARRSDVESKARAALPELARTASGHKARGEAEALAAVVARVKAWRLPALLDALRAELEAVAAPSLPSAEAKAWAEAWAGAAPRAAGRDFAGALASLRRAAADLREAEVRKEAAADIEELQALEVSHRALLDAAAALPAGRPLALDLPGGRVAGTLVRNGPERAELKTGKGPAYAEWAEVGAASLARLARTEEEKRALALLALLEGDVEGARRLREELPAKALAYAAGAKEKRPGPAREEAEARELFYAAEREFASMETRGPAIEKYRALRNDFATSAVARGELARILRRSEAGKEYMLAAADARISGTFRRTADGAAVASMDSDEREALENFVELEFYALPGTSYRAWLRLGGCCREVLSFYLQGSEMTASDRRKRVAVEPGTERAEWVPSTLTSLKKEHKDHAKGGEPKGPARWDWVSLALPKYAAPGLKRIRLLTAQQGFGFREAVVSSLKTAVPKPAELEELAKARALEIPPAAGDPDLVLHWTFDEEAGRFEDASGYGFAGEPAGTVKRVPGRVGGAAELDGSGGHVAVKDAPELRLRGDLTVSLWLRKNAEVGDWVRLVGKGGVNDRIFGVWEEPHDGKRILWQIYKEDGGGLVNMTSNGTIEAGRWTHVACVRRGRDALIYLDGRLDARATAEEGAVIDSAAPVVAGLGHHAPLDGALDDLRLYRRALTDEELQVLYQLGQ